MQRHALEVQGIVLIDLTSPSPVSGLLHLMDVWGPRDEEGSLFHRCELL